MLKEDLIVLTITEGQTGMDISYLPGQRKALGLLCRPGEMDTDPFRILRTGHVDTRPCCTALHDETTKHDRALNASAKLHP